MNARVPRLRTRSVRHCESVTTAAASRITAASERDVVMLLPRILELLVAQLAEPECNPPPRGMGHDHLVDEALARRHERIGEARLIFGGAFGNLRRRLAAED